MAGKYKYLTFEDRQKIEAWHARGDRPLEIAARLGVHTATIYNELKRGYVGELDSRQREILSEILEKLLKSAIANAENNNGMNRDNLYVAECYANKGPTMKRIRPRAQGRAYRIEKRMSHITIVLDEK